MRVSAKTFIANCDYSCQSMSTTSKIAGETQNMPRLWAKLQKKVDWDDQVPLADQVHFGCTQRATQVNSRNVMEKQLLFSKLITTSTDVKTEDITAWSFDMEGHVQKCVVERYCVVAHKAVDRHHNVSTPSLDDHLYDCTQQQLEDQTYFGQLISWPDQSQSGTEHAILD